MKSVYPIIIKQVDDGMVVHIPDFNADTQGENIAEAIEMARDAIGLMGIDMQDDKKDLPTPSKTSEIHHDKDDIITLVDIDFDAYRRKNELRSVKKNCTIPSWLNYEAELAGINFSSVLQEALKQQLNIR